MQHATFLLAAILFAEPSTNVGYIVGMYSAKDTRGLGGAFEMKVDGKRVATLRFPTYYRLAAPPGAYTVTMDGDSKLPIVCHVIAGESCYVRARLIGKDNRREVALVSPNEAFRQLRQTIPLEQEKIYIRVWK